TSAGIGGAAARGPSVGARSTLDRVQSRETERSGQEVSTVWSRTRTAESAPGRSVRADRRSIPRIICFAGLLTLLSACAPSAQTEQSRAPAAPAASASQRTLNMSMRTEVKDLAPKIPGNSNPSLTERIFNAEIAIIDGKGEARAYLVESLPRLNTDDWRIFPDGRMDVTYRLRPNLTWHD